MSLALNNTEGTQSYITTSLALKTAILSKGQQDRVGEMAINLITSAVIIASLILPIEGDNGHNINIKV